jgi:hypothetical protein
LGEHEVLPQKIRLADHETGAPEAMAICSKKKGTAKNAN